MTATFLSLFSTYLNTVVIPRRLNSDRAGSCMLYLGLGGHTYVSVSFIYDIQGPFAPRLRIYTL